MIRFENTFRANVDALRAFRRTQPWPRIRSRWLEAAIVAVGLALWSWTTPAWLALAVVVWFRREIRLWRGLRKRPRAVYEVVFDADGVTFRTAGHEATTAWSAIAEVVEGERVVLLLAGPDGQYGYVPVSAFPDEVTRAAFVRAAHGERERDGD